MDRLPIEDSLPTLAAKLADHAAVVLQAPPGAGKTTLVPLALLAEPWLAGKSILMLEPRRLAARAAAARMASLRRERVGQTVGYRIRFDSVVGRETRIEVLTEGILTRRLQTDAALEGVGLVIFDEFHERHLQADLALALCLDVQRGLREDLKILVMSATLDGAAVSSLMSGAPIVAAEGRSFPVEISYAAKDLAEPSPERVSEAIRTAVSKHEGDVLAFLPGAWEIRRTQSLLEDAFARDAIDVHPLYGDLPWEQQDAAIRPSAAGRRKIVLATPIAETSLTIEGVRVVVDGGFARVPQFDPPSGLTRLATVRVSRASAEQRAGRAGRTAPGVCYRLWTETTQRGLVPQTMPEIKTADLAPLALELAAWGAREVAALAWLDPPPAAALAQARDLLRELDALDADHRITDVGREMARLPLHPRLSHMLLAAKKLNLGALACDLAALLSERELLAGAARRSVDVAPRLEALAAFRSQGRRARSHEVDVNACARAKQAADQWRRLIGVRNEPGEADFERAGLLLAFAYPDRIAQRRDEGQGRYLLAGGRGARLPQGAHFNAQYIVAANLDMGASEGKIFLAAEISIQEIEKHLGHHVTTVDNIGWNSQQQAVVAQREKRMGALVLEAKMLRDVEPTEASAAVIAGIRELGLSALPWTDALRAFQARVSFMREQFPNEDWPDLSDDALLARLEDWLSPFLAGISRRSQFSRIDLDAALRARLDWARRRALDEHAPTHLEVPSGSRVALHYAPGEPPVLAVKLQEMFGLADTPRIARGRVSVTLHLLSPAHRPIQVTQDLHGFWERTYPEVKKELKGRYPKHPWPDDPYRAQPTARAKRARR